MPPCVSVIVPNFNHAIYLNERITSILNQTFKDFELIILDDLSNDNSREIIENYRSESRVTHIIYNQVNSGSTFVQWAKGIELSSGEYIWIAESDDWCEPTFLETLMKGLLSDKNIGLAFCQSCMVVHPNNIKEISFYPFYEKATSGSEFIREYMLYSNRIINASMVVWRKSLFDQIKPDYKEFRFSGDWLFWISLLEVSDVYISGRVLNYFRKHQQDVSGEIYRSGLNYLEDLKLFEILLVRNILSKQMFINVVKARYIVFLTDKKIIRCDVGKDIRNAYGQYIPVQGFTDPYYKFKALSRFIKRNLFEKA